MKKILSLILAAMMLFSCVAAFASCKQPEEKGVKVIEIKLTEEEYAFAVRKGNTELLNQLNAFMAEIKANGQFNAIIDKYFGGGTPSAVISAKEKMVSDDVETVYTADAVLEPVDVFVDKADEPVTEA